MFTDSAERNPCPSPLVPRNDGFKRPKSAESVVPSEAESLHFFFCSRNPSAARAHRRDKITEISRKFLEISGNFSEFLENSWYQKFLLRSYPRTASPILDFKPPSTEQTRKICGSSPLASHLPSLSRNPSRKSSFSGIRPSAARSAE